MSARAVTGLEETLLSAAADSDGAVSFFFQAEDGIRDYKVTGVQTCALPICVPSVAHRSDLRGSSASSAQKYASEPETVGREMPYELKQSNPRLVMGAVPEDRKSVM